MKRGKPMRRAAFKRAVVVLQAIREERARVLPAARSPDLPRGVMTRSLPSTSAPVLKDEPVRSEPYRRLVAALPCYRCGAVSRSQAAHGDQGKGMGIKACDLTCWPGCGPYGGLPGCHYLIGTSGLFTREYRREFEAAAAVWTQDLLRIQADIDPHARKVLRDVGLLP